MSLLIFGASIIDGVAEKPIEGKSIWIESGRIKAIGGRDEVGTPRGATVIDARGKYVIAGLMNANVHLFAATSLERITRHMDHYEDIIAESAQVALKNGLTTVFDTWGPRRFLMAARDRINSGEIAGARIFCAGNIIGFDGPFSPDFLPKGTELASANLTNRINAIWVENVGRHLMWLSPNQVAAEVRSYIGRGIDFIKYASNEHYWASSGAFLAFSPQTQEAIVKEGHRAGLTAQAHTMSVEGLRIAVEAGCDLIQHANVTGPVAIPEETLELIAKRKTGAVVFPLTQRRLDGVMKDVDAQADRATWKISDTNARNLIRSGASILLANDGFIMTSEKAIDPLVRKSWAAPGDDNLFDLGTGHFAWLKAMEEKGCAPMEMLKAATRNIAEAYGKDKDLGTLVPGKIADALILDKNPLEAAENYRRIHMVIKDGAVVERETLPINSILTRPIDAQAEEESSYVPFMPSSGQFPMCPMCLCR